MKATTMHKPQFNSGTIKIDGAFGEGGGQVLRSALSLSAITGRPLELTNIRAGRKRPGLMRQHLTCVEAVAALCGAEVSALEVGTTELHFTPGAIRGGDFKFAIGTAGSTSLVTQAILPVALFADKASTFTLQGGTHARAAPCTDFLAEVFLPALSQMGVQADLDLLRHGFFPAGGGEVRLKVQPWSDRRALHRHEPQGELEITAEARGTKGIPESVLDRELAAVRRVLGIDESACFRQRISGTICDGNALLIRARDSQGTLSLTCGLGERGLRAEKVAKSAAWEMQRFLAGGVAVDEYLADQLLLPMALAREGNFTTHHLSQHFTTNTAVIQQFLDVDISTKQMSETTWQVRIA